jgi:uncharacterized membrane protein YqgA involved in biofilm formation
MHGLGTLINVLAIVVGATIGVALGHRMPERTRDTVTSGLGLVTLVVAALSIKDIVSPELADEVGSAAPLLIVLGGILIGGVIGSLLRIEERLEQLGSWAQSRLSRREDVGARKRFVEGFVDASLLMAIGPLAILGSISDGLGNGIDQLVLKSSLDLVASIAFAAALGWGVALAAVSVGVVQGAFTIVGFFAGQVVPGPYITIIAVTGGVILLGVGFRMLRIKAVPVADLLPALVCAPVLMAIVAAFVH